VASQALMARPAWLEKTTFPRVNTVGANTAGHRTDTQCSGSHDRSGQWPRFPKNDFESFLQLI